MDKVVVFGTFDPLHKGHIEMLKEAKRFGYLIVVVSHDDKIRLQKDRKPRESAEVRRNKVLDLDIANEVIISEGGDEFGLLEKISPDIIALGYDQKVPEPLKNQVKKYKIITLKPFKTNIYKSSLLKNS